MKIKQKLKKFKWQNKKSNLQSYTITIEVQITIHITNLMKIKWAFSTWFEKKKEKIEK